MLVCINIASCPFYTHPFTFVMNIWEVYFSRASSEAYSVPKFNSSYTDVVIIGTGSAFACTRM